MKKEKTIWMIAIATIIIFVIVSRGYYPSTPSETGIITDWQAPYKNSLSQENIESKYLEETDYYDYSSKQIQSAINEVLSQSNNPREAVDLALEYVYGNVEYVYGEPDLNCFNGKASLILESGKGQCDTQSMVLITILRGMGIAARPVGGCAYSVPYAVFVEGPITEPINIDVEKGIASRGGALHAWVEAWIPNEGWVPLEITRGVFQSELKGYDFNIEMYPENEDKYHLCVSTDLEYARWCARQ